MLTPLRVLTGLTTLCLLSLLAVILSIGSHPTLLYLGLAGYTAGGAGICVLVTQENLGKLPLVFCLPRFQLPTLRLPELPKGRRVLLLGLVALATFCFLPPLVRLVYPEFGGFAPDTINATTLGAFQFFAALTLAYAGWRLLFPSLYAYAAETMEGKLLESITADLLTKLPSPSPLHAFAASFGKSYDELQAAIQEASVGQAERLKAFGFSISAADEEWTKINFPSFDGTQSQVVRNNPGGITGCISRIVQYHCLNLPTTSTSLADVAERRKIATLQFTIRCARFVFSVSPFVFFFVQATHALTAALTAVPAGALGS